MINIGITGSNGMLGNDLIELLSSNNKYNIKCFDLPDYDITQQSVQKKIVTESDIIVNCAAYTAVDAAESNIETCYKVNADAVEQLGILAAAYNKYLIHISTDFVFGDSSQLPLNENYPANPLSVYGASKLKGEQLLLKTEAKCSIIRIQWTYGRHGSNFISKILEFSSKFASMKVVADQVGSPTCTEDIAKAILCFIEKQPAGLYHFAAKDYVSRYETAKFIFNELKVKTELTPCGSKEFPAPAERPKNSRFDCSKIDTVLDFQRPDWQTSLKKYLNDNYLQ